MGQENVAFFAFDPDVILRSMSEAKFAAVVEVLGMILDPRMTEPHVIGDEVQHQLEAVLLEPLT